MMDFFETLKMVSAGIEGAIGLVEAGRLHLQPLAGLVTVNVNISINIGAKD